MSYGLGYEVGPIRPPSEADSLLIRVTRGCHWNRCGFCPVYKDHVFERRPVAEVLADVKQAAELHGDIFRSAFLQDADSLQMPATELAEVIRRIKAEFPRVERITTYSRSATLYRLTLEELVLLREAGLSRVHVGLESGSKAVLKLVLKGASPASHVQAGQKVREAGLSLSEYVMPGLGGSGLWREHAVETAQVLNRIDPDFIRLRSLFITPGSPLDEARQEGRFTELTDDQMVEEIRLFLEHLDGISSRLESDHSLNLLMELRGRLPEDKPRLLGIVDRYLGLSDHERLLFRLGRRLGLLGRLDQLADRSRRELLEERLRWIEKSTVHSTDEVIRRLMGRYI